MCVWIVVAISVLVAWGIKIFFGLTFGQGLLCAVAAVAFSLAIYHNFVPADAKEERDSDG